MSSPSTTTPPLQQPLTSFTLFPKLPKEVRLTIWESVPLDPRIVYLEWKPLKQYNSCTRVWSNKAIDNGSGRSAFFEADEEEIGNISRYQDKGVQTTDDSDFASNIPRGFRSQAKLPGILLACKESFAVASKIYTRAFGTEHSSPQTWFNFEIDTLYLDLGITFTYRNSLLDALVEEDLHRVQKLYMENDDYCWILEEWSMTYRYGNYSHDIYYAEEDFIVGIHRKFKNLREFRLGATTATSSNPYKRRNSEEDVSELRFVPVARSADLAQYYYLHPRMRLKLFAYLEPWVKWIGVQGDCDYLDDDSDDDNDDSADCGDDDAGEEDDDDDEDIVCLADEQFFKVFTQDLQSLDIQHGFPSWNVPEHFEYGFVVPKEMTTQLQELNSWYESDRELMPFALVENLRDCSSWYQEVVERLKLGRWSAYGNAQLEDWEDTAERLGLPEVFKPCVADAEAALKCWEETAAELGLPAVCFDTESKVGKVEDSN